MFPIRPTKRLGRAYHLLLGFKAQAMLTEHLPGSSAASLAPNLFHSRLDLLQFIAHLGRVSSLARKLYRFEILTHSQTTLAKMGGESVVQEVSWQIWQKTSSLFVLIMRCNCCPVSSYSACVIVYPRWYSYFTGFFGVGGLGQEQLQRLLETKGCAWKSQSSREKTTRYKAYSVMERQPQFKGGGQFKLGYALEVLIIHIMGC